MRTIWYTREDLKARIDQCRDNIELLNEVIEEHIMLYHALEGKENCVIDNHGKVIKLGPKPEQTTYEKNKPRESALPRYKQKIGEKQTYWNRVPENA